MNVAVPWFQHSPMFGQCASSQTVCRFELAHQALQPQVARRSGRAHLQPLGFGRPRLGHGRGDDARHGFNYIGEAPDGEGPREPIPAHHLTYQAHAPPIIHAVATAAERSAFPKRSTPPTYFVDRHVARGPRRRGRDRVRRRARHLRAAAPSASIGSERRCAIDAGRAPRRARRAAAARRPGVRLRVLRRDQDRRGAGADSTRSGRRRTIATLLERLGAPAC